MTGFRQRERLITRVKQIRSSAPTDARSPTQPARPETDPFQALEVRVAHLEELLEGLQDSVHRESVRQSRRLADLEAQLEPSALAVALSEDARKRGL